MSSDSPRIGYVVKRFPRYSETFIVNEIVGHQAAGCDLEIFSLRPPNDTHFQDTLARVRAPVHYLPSEGLKAADLWSALQETAGMVPDVWRGLAIGRGEDARDVYQGLLLAREVRLRGITHLHAHFAGLPASVARLASRFANVPFTFTAHAKDIFHETVSIGDLQRKLADAAAAITVSDFNLLHLRAIGGPAAARTIRIYNGVDLERFTFTPPDARPLSRRIVSVGRLVEKKGVADLIDACALLSARCDFTCEIIGTGELEAQLRSQIERLGLASHIHLIGPRPQAEIVEIVRNATVFAAPCVVGNDGNRDGLPTTLVEAMALGTPCVATDVTGIPEILRNADTGLLVRQHDVSALAAAIGWLLDDVELRVALARKARKLIEGEFDVLTNSARLRSVFREAAAPVAMRI